MACVNRCKPKMCFWLHTWSVLLVVLSHVNPQEYQEPQYSGQQGEYPDLYPYSGSSSQNRLPSEQEDSPLYQSLLPGGVQNAGDRRDQMLNRFSQRDVVALLNQIDVVSSEQCYRNVEAQWLYETNINPDTQLNALRSQMEYSNFQRALWEIVRKLPGDQLQDPKLQRQIRLLSVVGPSALPPEQLDRYNRLINDMLTVYYRASICAHDAPFHCGLTLEPALTLIMARSRDWDELQHVWVEWRRQTGQKLRDLYEQLVDLSNEVAHRNGLHDFADYWMFPYDSDGSFRSDVDEVWREVKPLYEQVHAYVRRKLRDLYGPDKISRQAPLPEHILGNMWGQTWSNILDVTIPYPGKHFLDVTPQMIEQGYTPLTMFQLAEDFYLSLNLSAMPPEFWTSSIFAEPPDRPVVCDASAWDFCNRRDYRIKMCTHVNMKDFVTVHHEMGHVQYFLQYRGQPKVFRDGANPGFHEAVGDAVALSVSTPNHLQTRGLVNRNVDDLPHTINYLFSVALDKIAFLPYSYLLDRWRWEIFEGSVSKRQYNCHFWRLREILTGVKPPLLRSEFDFDPGSKYHIPANIPYIRYFVGTVLQFQLHKALCIAAGQYNPLTQSKALHKCDIYRSKEAGNMLRRMMELGSSLPWQEALFLATGERKMNGSAIREYFRPLENWLRQENLRTQEFVGWVYDGDYCKSSIETANLEVSGGFYGVAPHLQPHCYLVFLITTLTLCFSRVMAPDDGMRLG